MIPKLMIEECRHEPMTRRISILALIGVLVLLGVPHNFFNSPDEPMPEHACGTGTVACCCGVAGGCGTCPTEQKTVVQREAAQVTIGMAACPGPAREVATPGGSFKYIMPALSLPGLCLPAAERLIFPRIAQPKSAEFAPETPPPRFVLRIIP